MADVLSSAALAAEAGLTVWQAAEKLGLSEKITDFFRKKPVILFLGSTGTGKTNMIQSLNSACQLIPSEPRTSRTEAVKKHRVRIDKQPFVVFDTPGQRQHQAHRIRAIRESLGKDDRKLRVINVVSYGFHEYTAEAKSAVDPDNRPNAQYLEQHRATEVDYMAEWLPLLGDRSQTEWIVTAVTKADLWWPNYDDVIDHYRAGDYGKAIQKEDAGLNHAVLPYCAVFHRFYRRMPLPGVLDDDGRLQVNLHFLKQLVQLG
jgi:hypothetical protein